MGVANINRLPSVTVVYLEYLLIFTVSQTIVQHFSTVSGCASFRYLSSSPKSLRNRTLLFNKCLKSDNKGQRKSVGLHKKGKVLL